MVRGNELSNFQRGVIIGCHLSGMSVRDISRKLQHPKSTIFDVIRKWKHEGAETVKQRSGRPSKMTDRARRTLKRVVVHNRQSSANCIAQEFREASGIKVSTKTIRRQLHTLGYHGRAAAYKPLITPRNARNRLAWCKARRNLPLESWKDILWTDESRYTVFRSDGRVWVWRMPGERHLPECVVPTVKFGGGSVMVWGCVSWHGLGPLVVVSGIMDTAKYLDVLDNAALPTLWQHFGNGPYQYQQDNAPCHTARAATRWFEDMGVQKLDWPAQSPDLNPIEALWDELERRVRARPMRPKSPSQLATVLKEEWSKIPPSCYRKLIENMPNRVMTVIKAKGGPTPY